MKKTLTCKQIDDYLRIWENLDDAGVRIDAVNGDLVTISYKQESESFVPVNYSRNQAIAIITGSSLTDVEKALHSIVEINKS